MNVIVSIVVGIVTGISFSAWIITFILEKFISYGDNKGDFKAFSKFPLRMISKHDGNGWF